MWLIDKLIKMGVLFPGGIPTRWHYNTGTQQPRTMICYEVMIGRGRRRFDYFVRWEYQGRKGFYVEACFPILMLTKEKIEIVINSNPEYGTIVLEIWLEKAMNSQREKLKDEEQEIVELRKREAIEYGIKLKGKRHGERRN